MKRGLLLIPALFLVLLLAFLNLVPDQARSAPQISLVHPAAPAAQLGSGAPNVIGVNVTSPGSSITSAEYQVWFSDAPGALIATEVWAQAPILPVPAPRAGAGARVDSTAAPAGLPPTSVVSFIVLGTVTAVNTVTGEWQIGTPPVFVYESTATTVQGNPAAGSEVRVEATRTLEPGPVIAEVITQRPGGALPAPPPTVDMSFLFNGTVESARAAVQSAGFKLGGATWTVGGVNFRTDDENTPAAIDPGLGLGAGLDPAVTVRFTTPLPTTVSSARAMEIFTQVENVMPATLHPVPALNTEPSPLSLPAGSWKSLVIAGVVTAVNDDGEWQIGNNQPPILVYEHDGTIFGGAREPEQGDEVRVVARRTLEPGPIVADMITFVTAGPLSPAPAVVSSALRFNGTVQAAGPATWSVSGIDFVVDDPASPAVIQPGLTVGSEATVEFSFVGPPPPDPARWAPLIPDAATGLRSAVVAPPGTAGDRSGFIFLRATDAQLQVTTMLVPANLQALPAAAPAAPTGLAAAVVSPTQVELTWTDTSDNEVSFRVERAIEGGFALGKQTFVVAAGASGFKDITAPANTILFYRVFAVNGAGQSAPVGSGPVSTLSPTPTPTPGGLTASATPTPAGPIMLAPTPTPMPLPGQLTLDRVIFLPYVMGGGN